MKKVKLIAGIFWAFLGLIVIIVMFPGLNSLSGSVSRMPFMKINPRYTGGEVAYQIAEKGCTLDIRKPVFNGFLRDRNTGFVQLDWRGNIPGIINDTIDYDNDGIRDFHIIVDRKNESSILEPSNQLVKEVQISTQTSYGWAVRVGLSR